SVPQGVFEQWLLGIGLFNLVAGYVSAIALGTVAAARRGRLGLAAHAVMMPAYWLAISFAAHRALLQLVSAPFYWEKTEHFGRPRRRPTPPSTIASPDASGEESQGLV
ncbi:MAG TPA: hypothetical protein VFF87_00320, partial [Hyphomicrobium sp.]|nr:hypothetical protein [Hyphomicrobium sp.]